MSNTMKMPKKRISGGTKTAMISVAILFDLAPILINVIMFITIVSIAGSLSEPVSQAVTSSCASNSWWTDTYFAVGNLGAYLVNSMQMAVGGSATHQTNVGCTEAGQVAGSATTIVGMALGGGAIFTVGFFMAALASAVAGLLSIMIFTMWFLAKGVNIWGIKMSRMGWNMLTFVCESVPFFNALLPMITINVIMQIRVTNKKDKKKMKEFQEKQGKMQAQPGRRGSERATRRRVRNEMAYVA